LRESVARLIKEEKTNLKKIIRRIKVFEKKYNTDFTQIEKNLPSGDFQLHEDYGEWSFLVDVAKEIEKDIANYEQLNGKVA
jgi:DNA-binding ferritin-like protein (Dps family)